MFPPVKKIGGGGGGGRVARKVLPCLEVGGGGVLNRTFPILQAPPPSP